MKLLKLSSLAVFLVLISCGSSDQNDNSLKNISAVETDLSKAPPAFKYSDGIVVPVDIETVNLDLVFDCAAASITGSATVNFYAEQGGFPIIDLKQSILSVRLNGQSIATDLYKILKDPDSVSEFRVLLSEVKPRSRNTLEITYQLKHNNVTINSNEARAGFFMWDIAGGGNGFWEQYGPSNFEYDRYLQRMKVKVVGTDTEHQILSNGSTTQLAKNSWEIKFPEYFSTSSFYFHLAKKGRFVVKEEVFQGISHNFPITIYAEYESYAQSGMDKTKKVISELEKTYGAFLHQNFVGYITSSGGGMEYCGATMSGLGSLAHEINHSWFARGVMPASGNAGWMDEAIVSWRDDGYPTASGAPNRPPVNLSGFSPYERYTTNAAYSEGAELISEFDYLFKQNVGQNVGQNDGMKVILKEMYEKWKGQTITTEMFKDFLEKRNHIDLTQIFDRYVYGKRSPDDEETTNDEISTRSHPRGYTKEELQRYH